MSNSSLRSHFFIFSILIAAFLFIMGSSSSAWLNSHWHFLLGWMFVLVFISISSLKLVYNRITIKIILKIIDDNLSSPKAWRNQIYLKFKRKTLKRPILFSIIKWASCPKCIAWWSSLLISFVCNYSYWQGLWGSLYLMLVGAYFSSTLTILLYLIKMEKLN